MAIRTAALALGAWFSFVALVWGAPPCSSDLDSSASFDDLLRSGRQLLDEGCNPAARDLALRVLDRAEREVGPTSDAVADALGILVEAQFWIGRRTEQEIAQGRRALALRLANPAGDSAALARSHTYLGAHLAHHLGNPEWVAEALDHFDEARRAWAQVSGPRSAEVAESLAWIAETFDDLGEAGRRKAMRPWIADLLDSTTEPGRDVAAALEDLASRLPDPLRGRVHARPLADDPAIALALRAVALSRETWSRAREPALGRVGDVFADCLNTLGNLLHKHQRFDEALIAYDESLSVRRKVFRPGHPQIARAYHNLGEARMLVGDFDSAQLDIETAYRERLALGGGRLTGPAAGSLHLLGRLYSFTGAPERAVLLYGDALPLMRTTFGVAHWQYAVGLLSLAQAYEELGDTAAAERNYRSALGSLGASVAPEGARTALAQTRLGRLLAARGKRGEGQRLLLQARRTQEGLADPPLADVAETLGALAEIATASGDLEAARELRQQAVSALDRYQGMHPALVDALLAAARAELGLGHISGVAQALERTAALLPELGERAYAARAEHHELLARLEVATGQPEAALAEAASAAHLAVRHLLPASGVLPPAAALRFTRQGRASLDFALTRLASTSAPQETVLALWSTVAERRGLVATELERRVRATRAQVGSELRTQAARLREAQRLFALAQLRPGRAVTPREWELQVRYAEARVQEAERDLAQGLARIGSRPAAESFVLADALRRQAASIALVAYVRFVDDMLAEGARYGAFVGTSEPGSLAFCDLGSAREIDRTIQTWRSTLLALDEPWSVSETKLRFAGEELRRRIWDPVVALAGGRRRFLVVPDGSLFFVPFAALPAANRRRYLIEDGYQVDYLVGERELRDPAFVPIAPSTLLAVGGPDFDAGGPAASPGPARSARRPTRIDSARQQVANTLAMILRDPCQGSDSLFFYRLPDASNEIKDIAAIFRSAFLGPAPLRDRVTLLSDEEATEETLKRRAPGTSILHLATHSFFDLRCRPRGGSRRGLTAMLDPPDGASPFSGLALAGANRHRDAADLGNDGILSAQEIAELDLTEVDWVVLSACETGIGQVVSGEGVLGLARAFRVAGAKSLVLSLWPVEDRATREWMAALYRARFERGEDKATAVRSAALAVLERRRGAGETTHPFFWAAFVGVGE